jgi:hypothetical protein
MDTQEIKNPEAKPEQKTKSTSKIIIIFVIVVAGFLVILASFTSGALVGFRKAKFSCDWGKNYERNFMGPRPPMGHTGFMEPMMREFSGRDFRNPHGLAGSIISISDSNLAIKDRDNKENNASVTDKTIIRRGRDILKIGDLKVNDQIVVIGKPDDEGVINADFIRVFSDN